MAFLVGSLRADDDKKYVSNCDELVLNADACCTPPFLSEITSEYRYFSMSPTVLLILMDKYQIEAKSYKKAVCLQFEY